MIGCPSCKKKDHPLVEEVEYDDEKGKVTVTKVVCPHCNFTVEMKRRELTLDLNMRMVR